MKKRLQILQAILSGWRWLTPGIGVKRWLVLLGVGSCLIGVGAVYIGVWLLQVGWLKEQFYDLLMLRPLPVGYRIAIFLALGTVAVIVAVMRLGLNLLAPFRRPEEGVADSLYDYRLQNRGPHIVAIGGGTGMPGLLRGLRPFTSNITAVVTVADDGGSSGRLREEFGLLPPGDFRNNLAALSRDETLMTQVMQYRFGRPLAGNGRGDLQGHAFGNLLLAALTGIMGSFDEALLAAERVLALRGRVLPSTLAEVTLAADVVERETAVTRRVVGESAIPKAHGRIQRVYLEPPHVRAYPPVVQAILRADLIVMGPGSLYTSILPNLLVSDLAAALRHARAPKIYVCNLAIQPGETDNYTVADHVAAILQHTPAGCLDMVLANDNLSIPPDKGGGETVYVQPIGLLPTAPEQVKLVTADLVDEERPWRHDSDKLARAVINLLSDKASSTRFASR